MPDFAGNAIAVIWLPPNSPVTMPVWVPCATALPLAPADKEDSVRVLNLRWCCPFAAGRSGRERRLGQIGDEYLGWFGKFARRQCDPGSAVLGRGIGFAKSVTRVWDFVFEELRCRGGGNINDFEIVRLGGRQYKGAGRIDQRVFRNFSRNRSRLESRPEGRWGRGEIQDLEPSRAGDAEPNNRLVMLGIHHNAAVGARTAGETDRHWTRRS